MLEINLWLSSDTQALSFETKWVKQLMDGCDYFTNPKRDYYNQESRVCCCGTMILSSFYNFKLCDDQGIQAMEVWNLSKS